MPPFRIQVLQRLSAVIVALSCLVLGGAMMTVNYADYSRFAEGVRQLERFHLALISANAVSAERGPANAAMGGRDSEMPDLVKALQAKRRKTDEALRVLALNAERSDDLEAWRLVNQLKASLVAGRAAVDRVVDTPFDRRTGIVTEAAIRSMFTVADHAARVRDHTGRQAIRTTPDIGADVILSTAASQLREYEGRLGSYVVMMLTSGPAADRYFKHDIDLTAERLKALRETLFAYADSYFQDERLSGLLTRIDADYFASGLQYALVSAIRHGMGNTLSAGAFTAKYVPSMKSSEDFRETIISVSSRRLDDLRAGAWRSCAIAGLLTATILIILLVTATVMRRRLFDPLFEAREQIIAIAKGDLDEPAMLRPVGSEIGEMFEGIGELRDQQREKRRLERAQKELTQRLLEMSQTDALTGLPNRRALRDAAARLAALESPASRGSALVMFDIDHFKKINDTYGHAVGDVVLRKLGDVVRPMLRPDDVFARYGGEEFILILGDVDEAAAVCLIESIRQKLSETCFNESYNLYVTASFGVAMREPGIRADWEALIEIADRRLYLAKEHGRNRVCISDEEPEAMRSAG